MSSRLSGIIGNGSMRNRAGICSVSGSNSRVQVGYLCSVPSDLTNHKKRHQTPQPIKAVTKAPTINTHLLDQLREENDHLRMQLMEYERSLVRQEDLVAQKDAQVLDNHTKAM